MTNDPNVVEQDPGQPVRLPRDPRLNMLLHLTHTGVVSDLSFSVVSGGTLFSGILVSLARWRELTMESAVMAEGLGPLLDALTQLYEPTEEDAGSEDAPTPVYEVLHLADARMLGGMVTALNGGVLRFEVDAIDGWMIGSFGTEA